MVSNQYFLQHLNSYHAVCVNLFILNPVAPWLALLLRVRMNCSPG